MPGLTKGTGLTLITSDATVGTVMVSEASSDTMLTETGDTMISET